jgi:hypothetical protein
MLGATRPERARGLPDEDPPTWVLSMPQRDLKLAGVAMMAIAALCTFAGAGIGWYLGSVAAGGFAGALVGVPVSLVVVWRLYVKPFSKAFAERDYSHLSPKLDDDE